MIGYIKLHRKIQNNQMYRSLNSKQRDVMIQCLLMANFKENEWEWGKDLYKCKPGQFITSLESIKQKCAKDISIKNIRTALNRLEKWNFLTNKSTKTGRLITICKWDDYQIIDVENGKENGKETAKKRQRGGKEAATNKERKEGNNINNKKHLFKNSKYCDIELIKSEIGDKYKKYNLSYYYEAVKNWSESKGEMKKDWLATLRGFILKDVRENKAKLK